MRGPHAIAMLRRLKGGLLEKSKHALKGRATWTTLVLWGISLCRKYVWSAPVGCSEWQQHICDFLWGGRALEAGEQVLQYYLCRSPTQMNFVLYWELLRREALATPGKTANWVRGVGGPLIELVSRARFRRAGTSNVPFLRKNNGDIGQLLHRNINYPQATAQNVPAQKKAADWGGKSYASLS